MPFAAFSILNFRIAIQVGVARQILKIKMACVCEVVVSLFRGSRDLLWVAPSAGALG